MSTDTDIEKSIAQRGITELVHFTSNHGLVGILTQGSILSRRALPKEDHLAYISAPTSATRMEAASHFDKKEDWLDYINLSISEINRRYFKFASERWHVTGDRWWVLLSFNTALLQDDGVYFSTTNNVYESTIRAKEVKGLDSLFADSIARKSSWTVRRLDRASRLTTCEQAEVLYPNPLPLSFLERIYVTDEDRSDVVEGWLTYYKVTGVSVIIDASKFIGQPN